MIDELLLGPWHLKMTEPTHRIDKNYKGEPYIECLRCRRKSFNQNDIAQKFCGHCHGFHPLMDKVDESP